MELEHAQILFFTIMAGGAVLWLIGFAFLLRTLAMARGRPSSESEMVSETGSGALVFGQRSIAGKPEEMCARAAGLLPTSTLQLPWTLVVTEQGKDRVNFKSVGSTALFTGRGVPRIEGGQMRFSSLITNQTDVDYAVQIEGKSGLLVAAVLVQVVALAALIGGGFLIHTLIVQSNDPTVRWQTFQAIQVVHFLWPVLLFCGLYRRRFALVRNAFDQFIATLPFRGQ